MKMKHLFSFVIAVLALGMLFVGCAQEHEHSWVPATCTTPKTCETCHETQGKPLGHAEEEVAGKSASCSEEGLTAGKKCSVCDEILVAQETIEKLHHTEETLAGKAATCTETGLTEGKKCSVCDEVIVAQEMIPANGHKDEDGDYKCDVCTTNICTTHAPAAAIKENEVAATCTKDGSYDSVVKCSKCGEELSRETKTVEKLGHTEEVVPGKAATCTATGLTDGKKCSVCGETLVAQEEIPTAAHTEEVVPGKAATCTETGLTDGKKCSVCGKTLVAQEEIPTAAHTEEVVPGKAATCTETGLTDGKKCSVCGKTLVEQEEIPANGHKDENGDYKCDACGEDLCTDHIPAEAIKENEVAATCTAAGSYDSVVKCANCGEELSRETKTVEALGHKLTTYEAVAPKCEETGLTYGEACSRCDHKVEQTVVPALGHMYGSVDYVWSADNSTCTASQTCTNDASHVVSETATVSAVELNVSANKVFYTYIAEFASSEYGVQSKAVEGEVELVNSIATINAPAIAGRVASHDYVKFGFHDAEASYAFKIYYSEVDVWDGTSVSTALSGTGTAADPYLIQSGADLAYLKSVIDATAGGSGANYKVLNFKGKYFKMTKSIDLNGHDFMIGYHKAWNEYECFAGIFDGNNCSIRGLNINPANSGSTGLFACVPSGGVLKNFSLYGKATGVATVGSAVAYLNKGTAENITSYVTVNATGGTIGGIIGNAESNGSVVSNCVNYGDVTSSSYIVGGVVGSGGHNVSNCTNFGNVTAGNETVGGVIGTTKAGGTISGCVNYGSVTITATDKGMVGGIVGKCLKPVSDCVNYGTINGVNTTGGICGSTTSTITNCVNYGAVNGTSWLIGGIAGSADADVTNCTNRGNITSTGDCVGGVVGSSKAKISGCHNYGTIKGTGRSAGIAYYSNGTIENCVNNGNVIGGWDLGGILAWVGDGQSATITNCTNNGNITGTWNNGGIFGLAHDNAGTVTITGCTNNGHITATTGGQISIAEKAVITECTENGSVTLAE